MSQENVEALRRAHAAFSQGDMGEVRAAVADDVEWGTSGAFPGLTGVYRGPEGVEEWAEVLRAAWEWFEVSLDEVIASDSGIVVVAERINGCGRGSGAEVEMRLFAVYWFDNAKVVRRASFTDRDEALEAAGLSG